MRVDDDEHPSTTSRSASLDPRQPDTSQPHTTSCRAFINDTDFAVLRHLTSIVARQRSILSRHAMLKILQPSRIIRAIMAPPPLIPLLNHHLLRRSHAMTLLIIPTARPRARRSMAVLQLIPRRDPKTENLAFDARIDARGPALAGLDAGGRFGGALAGGSAVDLA